MCILDSDMNNSSVAIHAVYLKGVGALMFFDTPSAILHSYHSV